MEGLRENIRGILKEGLTKSPARIMGSDEQAFRKI